MYSIVKGACGTKSHWTVIFDGEQVACRKTERHAFAYTEANENHQHCMDGSGVNYVWCNELTHCPSICECPIGECDSKIK